MLVREEGDRLHLLSVVSPEWIGQGKTISVRQAPTNFGSIAFIIEQPSPGAAILRLDPAFTAPPSQIVIHLPWFVVLKSAIADGKPIQPVNGALILSPQTRQIQFHWTLKPNTPQLSYDRAVKNYKAEYARRYQSLMHGEAAGKN
jgi:hypothetical protein